MSKWSDSPAVRLNTWITASLRIESIIPDAISYVTDVDTQQDFQLPFMFPGGETLESNTPFSYNVINPGGGYVELPYCIYTTNLRATPDQPYMWTGQTSYTFWSTSADKHFEIMNYLNDLLKRNDWSAADANEYFSNNDTTNPWDFKCIYLVHTGGPVPPNDQGGRLASMVIIRWDVTYEGAGRTGVETYGGGLGMIN